MWNHPKVGLVTWGLLALQFLQSLCFSFRKLSITDIASMHWREVHSCCFKCTEQLSRALELTVEEHDTWLPSLSSGYEDSLGEIESKFLAPTTSPLLMSSNWETYFWTLNWKKNKYIYISVFHLNAIEGKKKEAK